MSDIGNLLAIVEKLDFTDLSLLIGRDPETGEWCFVIDDDEPTEGFALLDYLGQLGDA